MFNIDLVHRFSENIKSVNDFVNFKFKQNENVFVRLVGENNSLRRDVEGMDNYLSKTCCYVRLKRLNNIISPDEADYYNSCYEEWLRSFRRKAIIKCTGSKEEFSLRLGDTLNEALSEFKKTRSQIPASVEKNFIIKLLFRFDKLSELSGDRNVFDGIKLVGENVSKVQEYLFFYTAAVVGGNVLLIQNKEDLEPSAKKLNLSYGYILGHMGNTDLPEYKPYVSPQHRVINPGSFSEPYRTSYGSARDSDRPRTAPPESTAAPLNSPSVVIPPRPNRRAARQNVSGVSQPHSRIASQSSQTPLSNAPTVVIPPRPNRRSAAPNNVGNYGSGLQQRNILPNTFIPQPSNGINSRSEGGAQLSVPPRGRGAVNQTQQRTGSAQLSQGQSFRGNGYRDGQVRIMGGNTDGIKRERSFEELANLASSVVQIFVMNRHEAMRQGKDLEIDSMGSGVMIGENGYIVTNMHVVEGGRVYGVRIENDDQVYFTDYLVKYHRDFDLAVLKIDRKLRPLPIFNDPKGLVRGQKVVAIGSPHGLFNTVSDGIISGFRNVDGVDMIQFTAPVSPGSSGGAVLNMYGELIGISRMIRNDAQNINLAVGYDLVLNFCRSFI